MNQIDEILQSYKPITLEEIDTINLMDRIDTKFIVPISVLYELLEVVSDYYVLEINGYRNSLYDTTYFDTINYDMFMDHAYDIENRQKIRVRKYLCNDLKFLEIKTKVDEGRTLKKRIKVKHKGLKRKKNQEFISKYSKYDLFALQKSLRTKFERFTLVNPEKTERITIDTSLHFINKKMNKEVYIEDVAILELKRNKKQDSRIKTFLNEHDIKSIGFSKYCLGMCLTNSFLPFMSFIDIIDKTADAGNIIIKDIENETTQQTLYVSPEDMGRTAQGNCII